MSMTALLTKRRVAMLSGYTAVQVLVQGVAFAAGLLLVRFMDQTEYGYYTLAISMVGLANVLLDLGLATAVLARGGPIHGDPARMGDLLGDAFSIQRKLLLGSLVLAPVFASMLLKQGLGWLDVLAMVLLVIACTTFNVHNAVALSLVRLRGDIAWQQRLEVGVNLGKLLLVMAAASLFLNAKVAVVLNLVAAGVMYGVLRLHLGARLGTIGPPSGEHGPALFGFIRRQAPNSIYYCFIGQIAIWLIGLFGSADRVAEVGALGRLGAIFAVIGAVIVAIVQPYFARITVPRDLSSGFIVLNGFFGALTMLLVGVALLAPESLLWFLGPRYSGLTAEVVWMVLASSLAAWSGSIYAVGAGRGWLVPPWVQIPIGLATLGVSAWAFDVSTVTGCFMMNSSVAAVALVLTAFTVTRHLLRMVLHVEAGA